MQQLAKNISLLINMTNQRAINLFTNNTDMVELVSKLSQPVNDIVEPTNCKRGIIFYDTILRFIVLNS